MTFSLNVISYLPFFFEGGDVTTGCILTACSCRSVMIAMNAAAVAIAVVRDISLLSRLLSFALSLSVLIMAISK